MIIDFFGNASIMPSIQNNLPYVQTEHTQRLDYTAIMQTWLNLYYMIHRNLPDEAVDAAVERAWDEIPADIDLIELEHPGYRGANITIAFNPQPDYEYGDEGEEFDGEIPEEEEDDPDAEPEYFIIRTYATREDELADNPDGY